MSTKRFPDLLTDTIEDACKWIREVTRSREEDIGDHDKVVKDIETVTNASNAAADVTFDNTTSGLTADDVQAALDEIDDDLDTAESAITAIQAITSVVSGKYCIGQIVTASKTDTSSIASTSFSDVSGLSLNITPGSTSSVIVLFAYGACGCSAATVTQLFNISNGTTPLQSPTSPSNRLQAMATVGDINAADMGNFFMCGTNSPASVSQQTYVVRHATDSGTGYVNRSGTDTDSSGFVRGTSLLMAIELRPIP